MRSIRHRKGLFVAASGAALLVLGGVAVAVTAVDSGESSDPSPTVDSAPSNSQSDGGAGLTPEQLRERFCKVPATANCGYEPNGQPPDRPKVVDNPTDPRKGLDQTPRGGASRPPAPEQRNPNATKSPAP